MLYVVDRHVKREQLQCVVPFEQLQAAAAHWAEHGSGCYTSKTAFRVCFVHRDVAWLGCPCVLLLGVLSVA